MKRSSVSVTLLFATLSACFAPTTDRPAPGDAGSDAGSSDAGSFDAGSSDAGSFDAGSFDAGSSDAGLRWTRRAPMPTPRTEFGIAATTDTIFTFGGTTGMTVPIVEAYAPALNQWTTRAPMPTARRRPVAATVGNKIYVIGGFQGDTGSVTYTPVTEEYDPVTDTWRARAPPPMPTAFNNVIGNQFAGGAVIGARIFVAVFDSGGNRLLVYDPATNTWLQEPASTMKGVLTATVHDGRLFLMSAAYAMGSGGDLARYDPVQMQWQNLVPLTSPSPGFAKRECATLLGARDRVLAIGGLDHVYSGSAPPVKQSRVDAFDPSSSTWEPTTPLLAARHSVGAVLFDGRIYAIGGNVSDWPEVVVPVGWVEEGE